MNWHVSKVNKALRFTNYSIISKKSFEVCILLVHIGVIRICALLMFEKWDRIFIAYSFYVVFRD